MWSAVSHSNYSQETQIGSLQPEQAAPVWEDEGMAVSHSKCNLSICDVYVCVCVCVWERERERNTAYVCICMYVLW